MQKFDPAMAHELSEHAFKEAMEAMIRVSENCSSELRFPVLFGAMLLIEAKMHETLGLAKDEINAALPGFDKILEEARKGLADLSNG